MNTTLICLHEEALRITHPVFKVAPADTKAIYVWDDKYFHTIDFSLKRLVFIYETLCELPVDIIRGDTISVIQEMAPSTLFVPATNNPFILSMLGDIKSVTNVEIVEDEVFVIMNKPTDARRFFQYWNKVEKSAFQHNGGANA
jgi:hypothetical protein